MASIVAVALIGLCHAASAADRPPIDVSAHKQLFLDDRFIAESSNVVLRMNQAQKLGLVLDEHGNRIQGHVSRVIEDQRKIRLYIGADSVTI
jgi:hypothetical protein